MDIINTEDLLQHVPAEWAASGSRCSVSMLRLDLVHPTISGNKWFKLKRNLHYAAENEYTSIITFGGAYSNHLHATAAAAKEFGLSAIGFVRGIWARESLTPSLKACETLGMELKFLPKEEYALREDTEWLKQLTATYKHSFIIPEGGANRQGREGAAEIAELIPAGYTHVCVSVGTGTTFTGLRNALPTSVCVLGFVPMIGGAYLHETIRPHLFHDKDSHWQLFDQYHFGGFGKYNEDLLSFMNSFYTGTTIPLDIVYTSKMMYGIRQLITNNFFPFSSKILCIHTGGLQGNSSVQDKLGF